MIEQIALVTDFGTGSPYLGQMQLGLVQQIASIGVAGSAAEQNAPARTDQAHEWRTEKYRGTHPHTLAESAAVITYRIPVIDLVSDLHPFRPDLAAYLLPALVPDIPGHTLYVCVVDPGVGSERAVLAVEADGNWYLGPDNGLLALVVRRAQEVRILRVDWRPVRLSDSFHGRDLFCPLAAKLVQAAWLHQPLTESELIDRGSIVGSDWPDDVNKLLYRDTYGNLITGIRANEIDQDTRVQTRAREIRYARTFSEVPTGDAFWYRNAFGLVELAVNQGHAQSILGLAIGDEIELSRPAP